jgi:arginine-tRNA-protein transferase
MAAGRPGLSLVTDYGEHGSSCGYCGREEPASVSHGMMAESLSVECYQALLDRWEGRLTGKHL